MVSKLKAQQHLLEGLDERIERSQLPDGFVRSVINDIRLDILMVFADIKILLTLKKQEAAAPTIKLKQQAHDRLADYQGQTPESTEISGTLSGNELPEIRMMMNELKIIEQRLKDSIL